MWKLVLERIFLYLLSNIQKGFAYDENHDKIFLTIDEGFYSIDPQTNHVLGPPIPIGRHPNAVTYDPDNHELYIGIDNGIAVIDPRTSTTIQNPIPLKFNPSQLVYVPSNKILYAADAGSNSIFQIDTRTNTVTENTIHLDSSYNIVYNSGDNELYAAGFVYPNTVLSVIDVNSSELVERLYVPAGILEMAYNVRNDQVYAIADPASHKVSVILKAFHGEHRVVGVITVFDTTGIAVGNVSGNIYVSNGGLTTVTVIDHDTNTVSGNPISVGNNPVNVAGGILDVSGHKEMFIFERNNPAIATVICKP